MKILIFIFALIFLTIKSIEAQVENKIGVSSAFTQTRIQTDINSDFFDNRSGICFAVQIQLFSSDFFSLVPQLEYTKKGFVDIIPVFSAEDLRADTRLDYVSIPIFIRFQYSKYKIIPYFKIGPKLDILINKDIGEFKIGQQVLPASFGKEITDFILGGSFAAGFEFSEYLPLDLFVEFRYNRDFTNSIPERASIDAKFSS